MGSMQAVGDSRVSWIEKGVRAWISTENIRTSGIKSWRFDFDACMGDIDQGGNAEEDSDAEAGK